MKNKSLLAIGVLSLMSLGGIAAAPAMADTFYPPKHDRWVQEHRRDEWRDAYRRRLEEQRRADAIRYRREHRWEHFDRDHDNRYNWR